MRVGIALRLNTYLDFKRCNLQYSGELSNIPCFSLSVCFQGLTKSDNKYFKPQRNILIELEKFGEISGLVCNLSKCEAMALGDSKQERITYNNVEIEWVEKMKITGITFGNKSDENRKEDVEEAISKMQTQLQIWSGRNLSILGKIQIVKTFGISQILYISNMLPLNTEEIRKVDKIISNFIWNNKPAKIRKTAMVADYAQGG